MHDRTGEAIKCMFQISPYKSMMTKSSNNYERKIILYVFSFVYHLHVTQKDKEKKIRIELLLYLVYNNFRR